MKVLGLSFCESFALFKTLRPLHVLLDFTSNLLSTNKHRAFLVHSRTMVPIFPKQLLTPGRGVLLKKREKREAFVTYKKTSVVF